jgi:hypothetical protein
MAVVVEQLDGLQKSCLVSSSCQALISLRMLTHSVESRMLYPNGVID